MENELLKRIEKLEENVEWVMGWIERTMDKEITKLKNKLAEIEGNDNA